MSPNPVTVSADDSGVTPGFQAPLTAPLACAPPDWSSVHAAAIAVAEAVAVAAAAEVAAEAARTAQAAVDTALLAAATAAARATQVAADAATAVAMVAAEQQRDAYAHESGSVSHDLAVRDAPRPPPQASAGVPPIFVVDDDAVSQVLIAEALSQAGLVNPVVALLDGVAAMAELSRLSTLGPEHVPGLVFLDWQMPGCAGIEVLRWMRARPLFANVPVVMLSGDSSAQKVKQAYDLGASSYLVKPLAFSALGGVVRGLRLRWQIA